MRFWMLSAHVITILCDEVGSTDSMRQSTRVVGEAVPAQLFGSHTEQAPLLRKHKFPSKE